MGTRGLVASGHYLATSAGIRILQLGGNAIDAAAAVSFCLNVLEPHQNGLGGEVPVLYYSSEDQVTYSISGQGWSPAAFTIDWCRSNGIDLIPGDGYLPACVPATVGTWALALEKFGTMSLGDVLAPAIEYAENGFPVYKALRNFLVLHADQFATHWPSTAEIYLPGGNVPEIGQVLKNPDLAAMFRELASAEKSHTATNRIEGIRTACDAFYRGGIAERLVRFSSENPVMDSSGKPHTGLFTTDDFAEWRARIEEPLTINYRGYDVHKCSSWTQGPVFLQQLALLEGFDLASVGHNTPDYIHTLIECAKLAFADREAYYGDPDFDSVPFDILLSKEYAEKRRELIGKIASTELRPGDTGNGIPGWATFDVLADNRRALGINSSRDHLLNPSGEPRDTTQLVAADASGSMVSATPSGGWIHTSPVIKGLGFPLGTRGQMFYLNPDRPNALAARKRPRATLTPTIVTRDDKPFLAFGTPGGDAQDQWTLQFFLNFVDFKMDLPESLDTPHWKIMHMPLSFYPRDARPGRVNMEVNMPGEVIDELGKRGHIIHREEMPLRMMAIHFDSDNGSLQSGVSATSATGHAIGW